MHSGEKLAFEGVWSRFIHLKAKTKKLSQQIFQTFSYSLKRYLILQCNLYHNRNPRGLRSNKRFTYKVRDPDKR